MNKLRLLRRDSRIVIEAPYLGDSWRVEWKVSAVLSPKEAVELRDDLSSMIEGIFEEEYQMELFEEEEVGGD